LRKQQKITYFTRNLIHLTKIKHEKKQKIFHKKCYKMLNNKTCRVTNWLTEKYNKILLLIKDSYNDKWIKIIIFIKNKFSKGVINKLKVNKYWILIGKFLLFKEKMMLMNKIKQEIIKIILILIKLKFNI